MKKKIKISPEVEKQILETKKIMEIGKLLREASPISEIISQKNNHNENIPEGLTNFLIGSFIKSLGITEVTVCEKTFSFNK